MLPEITELLPEEEGLCAIRTGQIWVGKRGAKAIKITSIQKSPYTRINYLVWDESGWCDPYNTSVGSLHEYYRLFEGDFEKTMEFAKAIIEGKEEMPIPAFTEDEPQAMAVMGTASKEYFLAISDNLQKSKSAMEAVKTAIDVQIESRKRQLQAIQSQMDEVVTGMKKQLQKIHRVIDTLELYMGVYEDIVEIQSGAPAHEDTPISFRQMLLFIDEEIALKKFDADFKDIETFDKWLLEDNNYKSFVPEEKCIVGFKPRRKPKDYGGDPFYNAFLNQENKKSYLLIRNGENIYRVWSDLYLGERLFPTRTELTKMGEEMGKWDKEKVEAQMHSYQRIAFVLQGLIDRTQIFQPIPHGIKIFELDKWAHIVNFIYDDEALLPSGRLSFKEWQDSMRDTIQEGSRIVAVDLRNSDYENRYYRYGWNHKFKYNYPQNGLYQVYAHADGSLCIKYNPNDTIWTSEEIHERKNRISFAIDTRYDNLLNYDGISMDDIDFYLHDRTDRKNYANMLPVLLEVKKQMESDKQWEASFIGLVTNELKTSDTSTIEECVGWWKTKNKWKRAITQNDTLALRMIKKETKKRLELLRSKKN